jgi:transcription initiation factor TFIIF subunit beta
VAAGEKFARLERNELVDRLFAMFRDKPYWGMGAMRAQLQQPDAWLREVLADVAVMIREGPYKNYWELKESWKNADAPGQRQEQEAASGEEVKVAKDEEDEDMDDDDEEDFEEILE